MFSRGQKVRLTDEFKEKMLKTEYAEHVHEFGNTIGFIIEIFECGYPEQLVEVYWQDPGLKYSYWSDCLVEIRDENRVRPAWFMGRQHQFHSHAPCD